MSSELDAGLHVDPVDAPTVRMPSATDHLYRRPSVRLGAPGARVHVSASWDRDAGMATWWRTLGAAAETIAQWYDTQAGAR